MISLVAKGYRLFRVVSTVSSARKRIVSVGPNGQETPTDTIFYNYSNIKFSLPSTIYFTMTPQSKSDLRFLILKFHNLYLDTR
jgi:hypothetical protein